MNKVLYSLIAAVDVVHGLFAMMIKTRKADSDSGLVEIDALELDSD